MDKMIKKELNNEDFDELLQNFEERYRDNQDYKYIKENIISYVESKKYGTFEKIVVGVVLMRSFDKYIYESGYDIVSSHIKSISNDEIDELIKFINLAETKMKTYLISILNILCQTSSYNEQLADAINQLNFSIFNERITQNDGYITIQEIKIKSQRMSTNPILDEIRSYIGRDSIDFTYQSIFDKFPDYVNAYNITETMIYLAGLERIPHIHCFTFYKNLGSKKRCETFINLDTMYCFENKLNIDHYRNICLGYYNAHDRPFPIDNIFKYLHKPSFLINFIEVAMERSDVINFCSIRHTTVDLSAINFDSEQIQVPNYSSIQFISVLLHLYETYPEKITKFIKNAQLHYDFILFGILQQPHLELNASSRYIILEILLHYIKCENSNIGIMSYVWNQTHLRESLRILLVQSLQEYFCQNFSDSANRMNRIINIACAFKGVATVLKYASPAFSLEFAIGVHKRNFFLLDQWMQEQLIEYKEVFTQTLVSYISKHYPFLLVPDLNPTLPYFNRIREETASLDQIIPFIIANKTQLFPESLRRIENLHSNYRNLINYGCNSNNADTAKLIAAADLTVATFDQFSNLPTLESKQAYVDDFLRKISDIGPNEMLRGYLPLVADVAVNVKYLQYYKAIDLTCLLILIDRLLVNEVLTVNRVLDFIDHALCSFSYASRPFFFIIILFASHREVLFSAKNFAQKWFDSPFYNYFPPFIRHSIEYLNLSDAVPLNEAGNFPFNDPHEINAQGVEYILYMMNIRNSKHIHMLQSHELKNYVRVTDTDSVVSHYPASDKSECLVKSVINQLNELNVEESVSRLIEHLDAIDLDWFAHYIVFRCITTKVNLLAVFKSVLKLFDNEKLYKVVRLETVRYIKHLLMTIKDDTYQTELDDLKVLGTWFGMITIGDNKPVLWEEFSVKLLIVESSFKGQDAILRILKFVKNFIFNIHTSMIFTANNPFVIGILSVLSEIYTKPDLRTEVKFEIEVISRNLGINVETIPPSSYLSFIDSLTEMNTLLPWTTEEIDILLFRIQYKEQKIDFDQVDVTDISNLSSMLDFNGLSDDLKYYLTSSIYRAFERVCSWVFEEIQKTINNLVTSIVTTDFRFDSEEHHIMYGAHTMTKSVSLGMTHALLTKFHFEEIIKLIKKELDTGIPANYCVGERVMENEARNKIVYFFVQNNINMFCAFIAKFCMDRMTANVDADLVKEYEPRRRVAGNQQRFVPKNTDTRIAEYIRETFKIYPTNPPPAKVSVYKEFNKHIPGFTNDNTLLEKQIIYKDSVNKPITFEHANHIKTAIIDIFRDFCRKLYKVIENNRGDPNCASVENLINSIISAAHVFDMRCLPGIIKNVVNIYFEYNKKPELALDIKCQLIIEYCLNVLLCLQDIPNQNRLILTNVTKIVFEHYADITDNVDCVTLLIAKRLVNLKTIDIKIAQSLNIENQEKLVNFAIRLTRELLVEENNRGIATEYELTQTLDILSKLGFYSSLTKPNGERANTPKHGVSNGDSNSPKPLTPEERSSRREREGCTILLDWLRISYSKKIIDINSSFKLLVISMAEKGILKTEDTFFAFIKISIDITHALFCRSRDVKKYIYSYQVLDVWLQFIILFVKFTGICDYLAIPSKMSMYLKILSIIHARMAHNSIIRVKAYVQKFYERILSGMILEITRPDSSMDSFRGKYIKCLIGFLHSLSPEYFPSFSFCLIRIISRPQFMYYVMCEGNFSRSSSLYALVICDLLRFIYPYVNSSKANTRESIASLFEKTVLLFYDLLKNYPDFLSYYHMMFINEIPPKCYQLRNIILCACSTGFSGDMDLSQPSEIPLVFIFVSRYFPLSLLQNTESYFFNRTPSNYIDLVVSQLENCFLLDFNSNIADFINAYIFHIIASGAKHMHVNKAAWGQEYIRNTIYYDILKLLITNSSLSSTAKYFIISALLNNLRFYSSHSLFVHYCVQILFASLSDDTIREMITRCFFERVACEPPHPPAILHTLKTLIHGTEFRFYKQRCITSPAIEPIFNKIRYILVTSSTYQFE